MTYETNLKTLRDIIAKRASEVVQYEPKDATELIVMKAYMATFKDASTVLKNLTEVNLPDDKPLNLPNFKPVNEL